MTTTTAATMMTTAATMMTTTTEAGREQAADRPGLVLGLRPRVLGWYALLLTLALALTSIVTFQQAEQAQRQAVEDELQEEVRDFAAGVEAGRADGLTPREAVESYIDAWPSADRDTLVVRIGADPPLAAGPIGADPALVEAVSGVESPRLLSADTAEGEARALVTPVRFDGRPIGGVAAAQLTQADRDALLERRIAVLVAAAIAFVVASGIAWFTLGRLLKPVKDMAAAADAIAEGGDLARRIIVPERNDEVSALAATFNRMLGRLENAFRREQRFIREASHELRTPMTICRGHLEVLGDDPDPAEVREAIAVVVEELDQMGRIVEDMTTLARVEDPEFLRLERVPLDAFVRDVSRRAEPLLDGRLNVGPVPAGAAVRADPQRLTQALINLLQNAAVHGRGDGPVELRITEGPEAWRFEVADRGGGIPPGEEERLFRPFDRASRAPGSGLGLAIVRGIAEAHGGRAGVDNRPGDGATFWITVPA
ncbi:MAG TPA: HAMP domain-containing sensor histidine kinase [Miltoncostaeaceae bacterium]|nr:HAMP domain-containing sensor histidine kinase [Miltoncostaeaceae bacterium]